MGDKNHKIFFDIAQYVKLKYNAHQISIDNFIRFHDYLVCSSHDLIVDIKDKDQVIKLLTLHESITIHRLMPNNKYFTNGFLITIRIYNKL